MNEAIDPIAFDDAVGEVMHLDSGALRAPILRAVGGLAVALDDIPDDANGDGAGARDAARAAIADDVAAEHVSFPDLRGFLVGSRPPLRIAGPLAAEVDTDALDEADRVVFDDPVVAGAAAECPRLRSAEILVPEPARELVGAMLHDEAPYRDIPQVASAPPKWGSAEAGDLRARLPGTPPSPPFRSRWPVRLFCRPE